MGESQAKIARRLRRSVGTIGGELKRNGGRDGYQAEIADRQAKARRSAACHGRCHIDEHLPLRAEVHARLRGGGSPEGLGCCLRRDNPDDARLHVSHESTYRYVYVVAQGELKQRVGRPPAPTPLRLLPQPPRCAPAKAI